jgi:hypothetical protein
MSKRINILKLPKVDDVKEIDMGDYQLQIVNITEENRGAVLDAVMMMYTNEPCRICGKMITRDDLKKLVFAGYSKGNVSRAAHGECWDKGIDKSEWSYPEYDPND